MRLCCVGPVGVVGKWVFWTSFPDGGFRLPSPGAVWKLLERDGAGGVVGSGSPSGLWESFSALDLLWSLGGLLDVFSFVPSHVTLIPSANLGKARLV